MTSKIVATLLCVLSPLLIAGIGFGLHFNKHYSMLTDAPGAPAGAEVFVEPRPSYAQGMVVALQTSDGLVHLGKLGPQATTGVVMASSGTPDARPTALRPSMVLGEVWWVIPNFDFVVFIVVAALTTICLLTLWPTITAWFPMPSDDEPTVIVPLPPAP